VQDESQLHVVFSPNFDPEHIAVQILIGDSSLQLLGGQRAMQIWELFSAYPVEQIELHVQVEFSPK